MGTSGIDINNGNEDCKRPKEPDNKCYNNQKSA